MALIFSYEKYIFIILVEYKNTELISILVQNFSRKMNLTEHYTEERIKTAANENLKDKIKERRYFVFE